jgi:HK97 family phage major capsid protein
MRAYKLAVIVPFSNEFRRDVASLYDALIERLPRALAEKFDATVFGNGNKPGDDFDNFASVTKQSLASDVYAGLVAADTDISLHGGIVNGYALSPQARGILLAATDQNKRPLFINNVAEGAVPMILGAPTYMSKGAFVSGSPSVVAVAGDWSQAMYGTVEGVKIDYSQDATLDLGGGNSINLFQQNMFAVRAEIEVGFRANTDMFNALTASDVPSI